MTEWTSFILNVLRFACAGLVVFDHIEVCGLSAYKLLPAGVSHLCVMIFFVVSGYVIAYTTDVKHRDAKDYFWARFKRIYTVLFPALVLTGILAAVGIWLKPEAYIHCVRKWEAVRMAFAALNIQEIWFLNFGPQSNGPLWSLCYEVWYYIIWGVFCFSSSFFKKGKEWKRWVLTFLACAIAGPKILLLMPVWLMGVACYKIKESDLLRVFSPFMAWVFVVGGILLLTMSFLAWGHFPGEAGRGLWNFSSAFLSDWFTGLCVMMVLLGAKTILNTSFKSTNSSTWLKNIAAAGANFSFSLYVTHLPLLVMIGAYLKPDKTSYLHIFYAFLAAICFAFVFSLFTENKKSAPNFLRSAFPLIYGKLSRKS
jgi:peptidoglycan/LPS O-acetylase OafA/YrhL